MSPSPVKSSPTSFNVAYGTVKVIAISIGVIGSILCLMSLVGTLTSNLWGQLVPALLIGVGAPLIGAERLSHDRKGQLRAGLASDLLGLVWLGFFSLYVVVLYPVTRPLLVEEISALANGGSKGLAHVVAFVARSEGPARRAGAEPSTPPAAADAGLSDGGAPDTAAADAGAAGTSPDAGPPDAAAPELVPIDDLPRLALGELRQRLSASLVTLSVRLGDGATRSGTGVVIDAAGAIVTAAPVTADAESVAVRLPDGTWSREVALAARDPRGRLALISIGATHPGAELHPVRLGDPDSVAAGDEAYCLGDPLGLGPVLRACPVRALRRQRGGDWLLVDGPSSAAVVGGPLVTSRGVVIGLVVPSPAGSDRHTPGLGAAAPITDLEALLAARLDEPEPFNRGPLRPLTW